MLRVTECKAQTVGLILHSGKHLSKTAKSRRTRTPIFTRPQQTNTYFVQTSTLFQFLSLWTSSIRSFVVAMPAPVKRPEHQPEGEHLTAETLKRNESSQAALLQSPSAWTEKCVREEGTSCYFKELLYDCDPTSKLRYAKPESDLEFDTYINAANRIGSEYQWEDTGLALHHQQQASSSGTALSQFCTISPAASPHPWFDRRALEERNTHEGEMLKVSTRTDTEMEDDEMVKTIEVLRGKYRRAGTMKLGKTRVRKAPRQRVNRSSS
ncbi:hypothetical protein EJ08DRAFT_666702 [Tothia fuscella]|uniref:Uncharacterized protein n=1 Tax=Tothia fuscella TaxID=1048955 RepID=A0A9P4TSJ5_9PEZI|nr:hypothetical protein EJ08DRAFT_666702 [Tothia fuscella]